MAKSPQEMKASMIAGLAEKTGKPLNEWLAILKPPGVSTPCSAIGCALTDVAQVDAELIAWLESAYQSA